MPKKNEAPRVPSLDIYHRVINIGKPELNRLSDALVGEPGDYPEEGRHQEVAHRRDLIRYALRPARRLRGEVLVHAEILRIQRHAGVLEDVDEEHVDELMGFFDEVFPRASRKRIVEAPTLPVSVRRTGPHTDVLGIAACQDLMQERALAKAALLNFYGLPRMPEDIWLDDDTVVRAAFGKGVPRKESSRFLSELSMTLEQRPDLLPATTEFGGIQIEPNPHR